MLTLFRYGPYGDLIAAQSANGGNPDRFLWRWKGHHFVQAGMYHIGERYYTPNQSRWTQPDPLPQSPFDELNANLYIYAGADPINKSDRNGMMTCAELLLFIASIAFIGFATAGIGTILSAGLVVARLTAALNTARSTVGLSRIALTAERLKMLDTAGKNIRGAAMITHNIPAGAAAITAGALCR